MFVPVEGFENYHVSNLGRVKKVYGRIGRSNGFITPKLDRDGYHMIRLSRSGKRYTKKLHRIVAQAFIANPENLACVNHLDFNRINNHVNNLEWISHGDNTRYSIAAGNHDGKVYPKGRSNKNYKGDVKCFNKNGELVAVYEGLVKAAEAVNGCPSNISSVILGKAKTAYGFRWSR